MYNFKYLQPDISILNTVLNCREKFMHHESSNFNIVNYTENKLAQYLGFSDSSATPTEIQKVSHEILNVAKKIKSDPYDINSNLKEIYDLYGKITFFVTEMRKEIIYEEQQAVAQFKLYPYQSSIWLVEHVIEAYCNLIP